MLCCLAVNSFIIWIMLLPTGMHSKEFCAYLQFLPSFLFSSVPFLEWRFRDTSLRENSLF